MKLNVIKIKKELKRLGKTDSWLAKESSTSKQLVGYWLRTKSLAGVEKIARALEIEPRDLII